LGALATRRGWHLALGLQLRYNLGKKWEDDDGEWKQENEYVKELAGLKLLDHKSLIAEGACLEIDDRWQVRNDRGCFVRRGRRKGLRLVRGPHLFLWNDWAAFSEDDFIFEHPKIALAGSSADKNWLRAVSLIWTSSLTQFSLVLELSSSWGIGRSVIDLGDAENVRMPKLSELITNRLGSLHREFSAELKNGKNFDDSFRRELDRAVAKELKVPDSLIRTATDFAIERLALNQGKAPAGMLHLPKESELRAYAVRLRTELDEFVGRKARHKITILYSPAGICASIEITHMNGQIAPVIKAATGDDADILRRLLKAAETKESQWIYVRRSVRIIEHGVLRLFKPPRRIEWTEARALLDADDVIAEIAASRR
jgi:hypothetical protein